MTTCVLCRRPFPVLVADPACPCGGVPALPALAPLDPRAIPPEHESLGVFRFAPALDLPPSGHRPPTLGEATAALEPLRLPGGPDGVLALREDLEPGGSWHDVGAALLVGALTRGGRRTLVVEGETDQALAVARYASPAGLAVAALAAPGLSEGRRALLVRRGTRVVETGSGRAALDAGAAALIDRGAVDARHGRQVLSVLGGAAVALRIVEALGAVPDAVVVPAGHGALLAGLGAGFASAAAAGAGGVPRLIGVQSSRAAPLAAAHEAGRARATPQPSRGAGLAGEATVGEPRRDVEALAAAASSGGTIDAVDDLALERAVRVLWREGLKIAPYAALPVAWLQTAAGRAAASGRVVVVLASAGVRDGTPLVERFP